MPTALCSSPEWMNLPRWFNLFELSSQTSAYFSPNNPVLHWSLHLTLTKISVQIFLVYDTQGLGEEEEVVDSCCMMSSWPLLGLILQECWLVSAYCAGRSFPPRCGEAQLASFCMGQSWSTFQWDPVNMIMPQGLHCFAFVFVLGIFWLLWRTNIISIYSSVHNSVLCFFIIVSFYGRTLVFLTQLYNHEIKW